MGVTRCFAICCAAVVLGCAKYGEEAARDTAAAAATMPAAPATLSLADVAGKWQVRAIPEGGRDTTATQYVLNATAEPSGWTITFPNRQPIPVHVVTGGDSIIMHAGPFESVRRKGVQVRTEGFIRVQNGKLVGKTVARYVTTGADSVLRLRVEGTRAP